MKYNIFCYLLCLLLSSNAIAEQTNLLGTWEATIQDNHYQMEVTYNQTLNQYEGKLKKQGVLSQFVGFSIDELIWTASPTTNPEQLKEQQKWRTGSNGVSIGFYWQEGVVYLNTSTENTLNTSHTIFRRILTRQPESLSTTHGQSTGNALAGPALLGNWRGSVYQPGVGTYIAQLSLHGTNGTVEYPSLRCGGTVVLLNNSGNEYRYAEHFTYGNYASGGSCINAGIITAKVQGDSMEFETSGQLLGRTLTAKGLLLRQPDNLANAPVHITALALGKTWKDRPLFISVPDHADIEVEVSFSASSADLSKLTVSGTETSSPFITDHVDYIWRIDGLNEVRGQVFKYKFKPGIYDVTVFPVNRDFSHQTTTLAMNPPPNSARVEVNIMRNESWACRGRMGIKCGHPLDVTVGLDIPIIQKDCDGNPAKFCIASWVSVGAIKHDKCCDEHPNGQMCNGLKSAKPNPRIKSDCEMDWEQAVEDQKDKKAMFDYRWIYPPNGNHPLEGEQGWWKGLAHPGIVVSPEESEPSPTEKEICQSGEVEPLKSQIKFSSGTYSGSTPATITSKITTTWVCSGNKPKSGEKIDWPPLVTPQGKLDTVGKKITPAAKSKAKEARPAGCNKGSSGLSPSIGGAQGALKKYGTDTDGCAQ